MSGLILSFTIIISFTVKGSEEMIIRNNLKKSLTDTLNERNWIKVDPFNLDIVLPSSGVTFYRDGIVYLSSSKYEKGMASNHISFGKVDARYAVLDDTALTARRLFSTSSSFTYPCDALTFSSDYNTMYFTKYSENEGVEKIYRADYSNTHGNWSFQDKPLSFCSGYSRYTHPALSTDGKLMVFASDRPGSIGGMDLYITLFKEGKWSKPINLGEAVNTTGNELYPYIDSQNNLYFSSDGIQGYGGFDIFICKFKSNTWENPVNLSKPINTELDDIGFTLEEKDGKRAFYTVREKYGRKESKLHMIRMNRYIPDPKMNISQYFTSPDISHMVIMALEPPVEATDVDREEEMLRKSETATEEITYRVQFMTSFNPRTRSELSVGDKHYEVFEYLYSGAYRLFIGEFGTLAPAVELQNLLRSNGYPGASVVAFKDNVLTLDPELLTERAQAVKPEVEEKEEAAKTIKTEERLEEVIEEKDKKTEESIIQKPDTAKTIIPEAELKKEEPIKEEIKKEPAEPKDIIVYRVQILSSTKPKGSYEITIAGKTYKTFEYLHAGAFRTTVGEFDKLTDARKLQTASRNAGYNQAFVIAFKNGKRSNDPKLFR